MAERRMFASRIVLSDDFLDLPMSARCLYFTLGMVADDDGFVNNPRSIMRQIGASNDDVHVLTAKKFLLIFDTGVIVIRHWRINNYLRSDRYRETKHIAERETLAIDPSGAYVDGEEHPELPRYTGRYTDKRYTQYSIGKDSIGKDSIDKDSTVKERLERINTVRLSEKEQNTHFDAAALIAKAEKAVYGEDEE